MARPSKPRRVCRLPSCTCFYAGNPGHSADCRGLQLPGGELPKFMAEEARLALNDGRGFGKTEGEGYMRMNIACPRSTVEKAMAQLKAAVDKRMGR